MFTAISGGRQPLIRSLVLTALASSLLVACGGDASSNGSATTTPSPTANEAAPQAGPVDPPEIPVVARRLPAYQTPGLALAEVDPDANTASCRAERALTGAANYQVLLTSASGETISFQVMEPASVDCVTGHPLMLHGHGFGGQRVTDPAGTQLQRLLDNGYTVISIDQRGFNESSGTVRVMDPNFEGRDLLQILDWAETHLDYLAHDRQPAGGFNLAAGATGGSYGGMYQLLIHNIDPQHRLDVLTPDITPHDLRYSLNPNGTIKSAWDLLLVAGGERGANQPLLGGLDPAIKETLLRGATFNVMHEGALPFFYYHSAAYFLDALPADQQPPMDFLTAPIAGGLEYEFAAVQPEAVDILFSQGIRDTLFNFNEAWENFQGYRALGGDVRLMGHESGHILPEIAGLLDQLGPLAEGVAPLQDLLNSLGADLPELQQAGGAAACGELSRNDAVLAFLNEKLEPPRAEVLDAAMLGQVDRLQNEVCLPLKDGEAVWRSLAQIDDENRVETTVPVTPVPIPNSLLGLSSLLAPVFIPLDDLPENLPGVAGIGALDVTLGLPLLGVPEYCNAGVDLPEELPATGCDAIVHVGWGARVGTEAPRLIDDQLTPLRGLGQHQVDMIGVAEALEEGEQLGLLVYGYHLQYLSSLSRDVLVPAVTLSGTVQVPVL